MAEEVELQLSAATAVVAREARLDQTAAGAVVAETARIKDSAVGFVVAREIHGENVRVLFGSRAAVAFGASFALTLWLLRFLRRR
jgi:hypothetical protein